MPRGMPHPVPRHLPTADKLQTLAEIVTILLTLDVEAVVKIDVTPRVIIPKGSRGRDRRRVRRVNRNVVRRRGF